MSSVAHPLGAALPVADAVAPVLVVLLGGGLVGMSIRNMFESIMSEDEASEADPGERDASTDGGGGLMAEAAEEDGGGDDDMGDLGGFEDDGDDLGGFEDDAFGDVDEGGDVDELEHRLDELEAEMGSLSSTVNTVRNENEQISESVGEVEENVRKLLDIYEMVTRGVNPFADDVNAGMAGGGMGEGGGFGLFDDEGGAQEPDAIDQDIAEADAEGFFDEELVDDEEELEADADVGEVLGDEDEEDEEDADDEFDEDFEDFEEDEDGGTSFQDLKEEYESGDAEWVEEDGDGEGASEEDADAADPDAADAAADTADPGEADGPAVDEELDDIADDDLFDEAVEGGAGDASDDAAVSGDTDASDQGATASTPTGDDGRPYLATLPEGFAADLLVVEWLEFLVGEAGVRETARAIDYYESIDWIAEPVADDLQDYLAGFDGGPSGTLAIDHHTRSLRYIGRLDGGGAETAALQRVTHGGGSDGIQR